MAWMRTLGRFVSIRAKEWGTTYGRQRPDAAFSQIPPKLPLFGAGTQPSSAAVDSGSGTFHYTKPFTAFTCAP